MPIDITYQDEAAHNGHNIGQYYEASISALETAIKSIQVSLNDDGSLLDIIEDLNEYISNNPTREIIGLGQKLINGNREDLLESAKAQKNRFARKLARGQMSISEQHIYTQVLSTINTTFQHVVRPLIIAEKSSAEIDRVILKEIIQPVHKAIVSYDFLITADLVSGMLYFLTGKCHLVWSK